MTLRGIARFLRARGLLACRRGATTVEFALVSILFFPFCFGTLEMGLMMWSQNSLQSIATQAARCTALGSSACPDVPTYVVNLVNSLVMPGLVTTSNVTVTTSGACNSAPGTATVVTIVHTFWGSTYLPPPLSSLATSVTGCYPTAA